jgi:hypothetical protein
MSDVAVINDVVALRKGRRRREILLNPVQRKLQPAMRKDLLPNDPGIQVPQLDGGSHDIQRIT